MSGTLRSIIPGGGTTSAGFDTLTSGTNTQAAMVVGSGASLSPTGTGTITASGLNNTGLIAANEYSNAIRGNTLPIFNQKMAGVRTSNSNCRVLCIGDSTNLGAYSGGSNPQTANIGRGYTSILQRYFANAGTTSQRDSIFADGDGTNTLYDSRITFGSFSATGANGLGGAMYLATVGTSPLTFTPTGIVDTFKIYYAVFSGGGVLSAAVDSGSATTQSTNGASAVGTITITATAPGIHTCNLKWSSGGAVIVMGIEATNSTIKQMQVMNAGWSGAVVANFANNTQPYSSLGGIKAVAPDLTLINLGINDWVAGTNLTSFNTDYQTLITTAKISGDCAVIIPVPSGTTSAPQATQDIYANAIRTLAATNGIPTIDIYARFVSDSFSLALKANSLHPNAYGYEVMTQSCFGIIGSVGAGSSNPPSIGIQLLIQTVANNTYTYVGYAGSAGTILGIFEKARALTTAGTFAIAINGTNVTGLSAVVPTTAGSYNYATALNTYSRGDQITVVYTGTSLVLDHTLTLDIVQPQVAL